MLGETVEWHPESNSVSINDPVADPSAGIYLSPELYSPHETVHARFIGEAELKQAISGAWRKQSTR